MRTAPPRRRSTALRTAAAALLALSAAGSAPATDPDFGSWWHDGKAELDGYRYRITRYGQPRTGQCAMIYVTEPFSESRRVKVEDPSRDPDDVFDALKLNLVRDFQTGVYDYNTMTSVFVRSADMEPVKVSFSSAEWCGHVYEELLVHPGRLDMVLHSYFQGESGRRRLDRPAGGVTGDELFILLRGLQGAYLEPGGERQVPFLAGALHRRLTHQAPAWGRATISRLAEPKSVEVPAGSFAAIVYLVQAPGGRQGRFLVEADYPHRILRWAWTGGEAAESGELAGSTRAAYWRLHDNGDESMLETLGLQPAPAAGP